MKVLSKSVYSEMFFIYLTSLEVWLLSSLYYISINELSHAEKQLKKLSKISQEIKLLSISDVLDAGCIGKLSIKNLNRLPVKSEVTLTVDTFYRLSVLQFANSNLTEVQSYLKSAFSSLNESTLNAKYIYSNTYSLLKYYETVISIKKISELRHNLSVEYCLCPSVLGNVAATKKVLGSHNATVVNTPEKTSVVPQIVVSQHGQSKRNCKAPIKKDVMPSYLKQDLDSQNDSLSRAPLVFSSDDEFVSPKLSSKENRNSKTENEKKGADKVKYRLFKSKNEDMGIKSSSDIWKCPAFTTPKASKKSTKSRSLKVEAKYETPKPSKQCLKLKSDSSLIQKGRTLKTRTNKNKKSASLVGVSDEDPVEWNRKSPISRLKGNDAKKSQSIDDVFIQNSPMLKTLKEPKFDFILDDLCKDVNAISIKSSNEKKNVFLPENDLTKFIDDIFEIRALLQHSYPFPLYGDICRLLAVLKMVEIKNSELATRNLECSFFLGETISSTLNHTHITNAIYYKDKNKSMIGTFIQEQLKSTNLSASQRMESLLKLIPKNWTVVQINSLWNKEVTPTKHISKLIVSQHRNGSSTTICIDSSSSEIFHNYLFAEFERILQESKLVMKKYDDAKKWWQTRSSLDLRLKEMVESMENIWLGCWKALLLGVAKSEERRKRIYEVAQKVCNLAKPSCNNLLDAVLDSIPFYSREQLSASICHLWSCTPSDDIFSKIYRIMADSCSQLSNTERYPVILILDKDLQCLPWENMPILRNVPVSRMPSLSLLHSKLGTMDVYPKELDSNKTFYILNPSGDLEYSQKYLQPQFAKQAHWNGIIGRTPTVDEYLSAFKDHDLFIYCGHGSGNQYIQGVALDKVQYNAAAVLMGCSSGRLKQVGRQIEAYGFVLTYLLRGCPCIVANLWDVTDKDIDRFTEKMFELSLPNYKTENVATTDCGSAVAQARQACKMRYLVGAAPVVYGLPVFAKKTSNN